MFAKKKISIDLTLPEYTMLKDYADEHDMSTSAIINMLVGIILPLSPKIKQNLRDFCLDNYQELLEKSKEMSTFEVQKISLELDQLNHLSELFKLTTAENESLKEPKMKRILLKDGYLMIPKDFIVLDGAVGIAAESMYAGVVESRNSQKYGIPHFVFFCDHKYSSEYDANIESQVYEACSEAYPEFKKFYNMQKKAPDYKTGVDNWSDPDFVKKMQEWNEAPTFGLFSIVEKGDPLFWNRLNPNYEPPFGAMIVRSSENQEK